MSDKWQKLFALADRETQRLGMTISLGTGPGWTGSGGPWVKTEDSMQHLVASTVTLKGPARFAGPLPVPENRKPFFDGLPPDLTEKREKFYRDVAVLAFPTPGTGDPVPDVDEKALYYRAAFSSMAGVKPYLPEPPAPGPASPAAIPFGKIIDVTRFLRPDGTLDWESPAGNWTIMRFGARNNGANTRPAPIPGLGFESDKFSREALDKHLANYTDLLLKKVGPRKPGLGWTTIHMDSWEMGSQNWTPKFREEFKRLRGYDPQPFYPAYTGAIVGSRELTERFLWDLRLTGQDLVLQNHAMRLKEVAQAAGMSLSIEPYDMNPAGDLELGAVADMPMGEFWTQSEGFNSSFSCLEATSIAHTMGRPIVGAESFTSQGSQAFSHYPAELKNQLDWALATGINRFYFHTFAHQPLGAAALPGMTFGPYGVFWQRNQTFWPLLSAFHEYISRASAMLQQGVTVSDILYLTPEGAPQVFRPPASAVQGEDPFLPDRRGYNFDGVAAKILARATVRDGLIVFPGGSSYRVLVLPAHETMTPPLLDRVTALVEQGATVIGSPPNRSPSLTGYPKCDAEVAAKASKLWGSSTVPKEVTERPFGRGRIFWGGDLHVPSPEPPADLYPGYDAVAAVLKKLKLPEDFIGAAGLRHAHRRTATADIYFVSNRTDKPLEAECAFRTTEGNPQLWDAVTGQMRPLTTFHREAGSTRVPLRFEPYQSYFVIFPRGGTETPVAAAPNFVAPSTAATLSGPWEVEFDPKRGGPGKTKFPELEDWATRPEKGIRYFSGIAVYRKTFDLPAELRGVKSPVFLDLGKVKDICRVRLNGQDLGVIWTAPWHVNVANALKLTGNRLEIEVANGWTNRLIGDQQPGDKDVRTLKWSSGLLGGQSFPTGRHTFILENKWDANSPLESSGLLGPVTLQIDQATK